MQVSSVKMEEGDIIVMGSDGLFDNVFDQELVSTVVSNSDDVTEAGISSWFLNYCELLNFKFHNKVQNILNFVGFFLC